MSPQIVTRSIREQGRSFHLRGKREREYGGGQLASTIRHIGVKPYSPPLPHGTDKLMRNAERRCSTISDRILKSSYVNHLYLSFDVCSLCAHTHSHIHTYSLPPTHTSLSLSLPICCETPLHTRALHLPGAINFHCRARRCADVFLQSEIALSAALSTNIVSQACHGFQFFWFINLTFTWRLRAMHIMP